MKKIIASALIIVMILLTAPNVALATTDTSGITEGVYAAIANGIENRLDDIDISEFNVTATQISYVMQRIRYRFPLIFYIDNSFYITWKDEETVSAISPIYTMTEDEVAEALEYVNTELDKIIATVPADLDYVEKAAYLHDYICLGFCYDVFGNERIYDIYNMLKNRYGVCDAYTRLYTVLLGKCGIEADGVWSNGMAHSWCEIKLGGKWYCVDVTWDDPVNEYADNSQMRSDFLGKANHNYFLKSTSQFANHDTNAEYYYPATDTKFDGFDWHSVSTPFAFVDGETYMLLGNTVKRVDLSTNESETIFTINEKWPALGGGYWNGFYSGLGFYNDKIIYNTAKNIVTLDPKTGDTETIFTLDAAETDSIYGLYTIGDTLYYLTAEDPNTSVIDEHTLLLETLLPSRIAGDFNGDKKVDNKDVTRLFQYISGWDVDIDLDLLDVNGDGKVNNKDLVRLFQYVSGWDVEIN